MPTTSKLLEVHMIRIIDLLTARKFIKILKIYETYLFFPAPAATNPTPSK